ncbi:type 1 glutamine amidotransferase [Dyadobacter chenwenxiniae]|uniref:Type 1 glutamine amidotransferase n=1 Tax=Dyadobacter chenwenxiniae TaxID=2906456 RepID=A0A9X1PS82_9BACT|nr:type 1 glutamine amidotransferase domain-containing protein [Dyadobacter chenwenxiniae]MCF0064146.1 type 1 glutamine amidotransferase [Dyadobacter chenwenxiniae]UON82872.1 type 1 glutamine amidotransferase [Dyadobacter chenwenxiniae]
MEQSLNSLKVAILVADGFEQVEMTCPRKVLNQKGATTHLISPNKNAVRGWSHLDWGEKHNVDVPLTLARADYYDALLLPGGVLGLNALRMNYRAVEFVKHFFTSGKPVAAICHGPQILIDADVVLGRVLTSYASIKNDLENAGARWVDQEVVTDNGLITSRTTDDLSAFTNSMIKEFNMELHH